MAVRSDQLNFLRRSSLALIGVLVLDDLDFSARGFTRFSSGSISYYRHTTDGSPVHTYFTGRTNGGTTIGVAGPDFSLGTMKGTPFTLHGSTFTALAMTTRSSQYGESIDGARE